MSPFYLYLLLWIFIGRIHPKGLVGAVRLYIMLGILVFKSFLTFSRRFRSKHTQEFSLWHTAQHKSSEIKSWCVQKSIHTTRCISTHPRVNKIRKWNKCGYYYIQEGDLYFPIVLCKTYWKMLISLECPEEVECA